jgi:hypothetical protein
MTTGDSEAEADGSTTLPQLQVQLFLFLFLLLLLLLFYSSTTCWRQLPTFNSPPSPYRTLAMSENIELRPVGKSANGPPLPPRHPESEPGTLGRAYRLAEDKAKAAVHLQEGGLDVVSTWGLGAAAWCVGTSHLLSTLHYSLLPQSLNSRRILVLVRADLVPLSGSSY